MTTMTFHRGHHCTHDFSCHLVFALKTFVGKVCLLTLVRYFQVTEAWKIEVKLHKTHHLDRLQSNHKKTTILHSSAQQIRKSNPVSSHALVNMSHRDDDPTKASTQSQPQPQPVSATPPVKKLRFRGDLNMHHFTNARVEDLFDEPDGPNRRGLGIQQRNANVQHSEMSDEAAAAKCEFRTKLCRFK